MVTGFVVDYLAEALRVLRQHNFTEMLDRYFTLGSHLNARDVKAVRKTVSGLAKLLYPHGEVTLEQMTECWNWRSKAGGGLKEQLKKLGSFEYHQTSFSYRERESGKETYVGVPEEGHGNSSRRNRSRPDRFTSPR